MAPKETKVEPDDPRLKGHETVYQASRGGHFPPPDKPVPGQPKTGGSGSAR